MIAVTGGKGSPGCTFVSVGLARCLAASGLETLLLDADAEAPSVAAWLDLPPTAEAFARALEHGAVGGQAMRDLATPSAGGLRALEVTAAGVDGRELTGHARDSHEAVVVDLGHCLGPLQRQLLAAADWVVWVAVPDRLGVDRADRALAAAPRGADGGLIANRCGRGRLRGAEQLLAAAHGLPLLARIPDRPDKARALLERRAPAHGRGPFAAPIREAARTVHPDCGARVTAWP
ncbi:MAG: hypothetical protein ACREPI_07590 [Candidatus Dormibacterales bacterium]